MIITKATPEQREEFRARLRTLPNRITLDDCHRAGLVPFMKVTPEGLPKPPMEGAVTFVVPAELGESLREDLGLSVVDGFIRVPPEAQKVWWPRTDNLRALISKLV